ncbi:hypothetical protein [Acidiphilium iwatense]|uniref:Uncharacterized protein n=1 Tax=Acidiphilium iwatense TaxID=768198 RepID=A0ABS9DX77_9PROT|nr:hypothetical protein [Acidiphilium iwatense]MCF3947341.1 hypothetical protein [Acidiphilium iwatense]
MNEINIPSDQQDALKVIEHHELDRLIEQAVQKEEFGELYNLPLARCGPYIARQLRDFEQALAKHGQAKLSRKRAATEAYLRRVASDLSFAVGMMKRRVETEQKEGQLFYIDDQIIPPHRFTEHLRLRLSYRWRRTVDEEWKFGGITFVYDVNFCPDYTFPISKRKPSAVRQEQDRQTKLYQAWEHLMRIALCSVRDYFREGGDGGRIPEIFQAMVDPHTRELNNYSAQFWRQQP